MPNNEEVTLKNGTKALVGTVRIVTMNLDILWQENPILVLYLIESVNTRQRIPKTYQYYESLEDKGLIDVFGRIPDIIGEILTSGTKDNIWTGDPVDHTK